MCKRYIIRDIGMCTYYLTAIRYLMSPYTL